MFAGGGKKQVPRRFASRNDKKKKGMTTTVAMVPSVSKFTRKKQNRARITFPRPDSQ